MDNDEWLMAGLVESPAIGVMIDDGSIKPVICLGHKYVPHRSVLKNFLSGL